MLSVGYNPTVGGKHRTIEVNIFDFDKDIYGEEIKVYFIAYLRSEEKFDGLLALQQALAHDAVNAKSILLKFNKSHT
jgi:riboflavin kinase/FMN adenylyltransferase